VNFGLRNCSSTGVVTGSQHSSTSLTGTSTAASLVLASTGAITDDASASLTVTSNASLRGSTITLGTTTTDTMNFGSLTFSSTGAVTVSEDSSTSLTGTSKMGRAACRARGEITEDAIPCLTITR